MSRNYSETLAYWYLRLNGFFPLADFVLHWKPEEGQEKKVQEEGEGNADCDLLAIRFPYVYEEIGGQPDDWDPKLLKGFDIMNHVVGLIVQVKDTTACTKSDVQKAFLPWRLEYGVQRLGMFAREGEENLCDNAVQGLSKEDAPFYDVPGTDFRIGKLVLSRVKCESNSWVNVTLGDVAEFIKNRLQGDKNSAEKRSAWTYFPDDLIQYLIWSPVLEKSAKNKTGAAAK